MTEPQTVDARIHASNEVEQFLTNETIKKVFNAFDRVLFERWKAAQTPAEREEIHAEARAFDAFTLGLRAVVDSGKRETHDLEHATRTDALA